MKKIYTRWLLFVGFVTFGFILAAAFPGHSLAQTPASSPAVDIESCAPSLPLSKDLKIYVKKGEVLEFGCKIVNQGDATKVLLAGERIKDTEPIIPSFVSSLVSVPAQGETVAKISFPVLLQSGSYKHTISLMDPSNGKTLGRQVVFDAVLNPPQVADVATPSTSPYYGNTQVAAF